HTARVWDATTGAELLLLKGHTQPIQSVAVTPGGAQIITGSTTARVWDAGTGDELLRFSRPPSVFLGVTVMPDGTRIVTGSDDTNSRVWDLAQVRPRAVQRQVSTNQSRQAVIDHAKVVVPRCLTVNQRSTLFLTPKPPGWCIEMGKYPYDAKHWKAWKAGRMADAVDSSTAREYGDFADNALKEEGNFEMGLEAAGLGSTFDPEQLWITINIGHALIFVGQIRHAQSPY